MQQGTDISNKAVLALIGGAGFFVLILVIIGIAFLVFWIMMLIHAIKSDEATFEKIGTGERTLWLLVLAVSLFVSMHWLSAIIYYFVIYKKAKQLEAKK